MRIGYSFWGFLGPGITDTPDGGRSHRQVLVDGLRSRGHDIVFLQPDRDHLEAGAEYSHHYRWDAGLPDIDVLFLEWRWPIAGRNTTHCGTPGHTCDLHRQTQLLEHYTTGDRAFTIIWDKDRHLPIHDPLRRHGNVAVAEAAMRPTPGAWPLLFPVADDVLNAADPSALASLHRDLPLVYIGNQYDRDDAFHRFFVPAARHVLHQVAGKWINTRQWPEIAFTGRIPFPEVAATYRRAVATVLLLPDRYAAAGQMTQRLAEAVLAGCLPITPLTIEAAEAFTPRWLHVHSGAEVLDKVAEGWRMGGSQQHAQLLAACLRKLDRFRLSEQMRMLDQMLSGVRSRLVLR
jgi:hypothetical protein